MSTTDDTLRDLVAQTDPLGADAPKAPDGLLDRILEATAEDAGVPADAATAATADRTWLQRHWQGSLLVAASIATLVLASPLVLTALFGLSGGSAGSDSSVAESAAVAPQAPDATDAPGAPSAAGAPSAPGAPGAVKQDAAGAADSSTATVPGQETADSSAQDTARLVRSGTVLVGTDDITGERDTFVAYVSSVGGRVMSESAVTQGSAGGPLAEVQVAPDAGISYPYPWYPSGPGIWLTVEVPEDRFEDTMRAAAEAGEVVQLQQSSYDVGAQIAEVDARIAALEASLQRLTALLGQAASVSDVVALESAIAARQAELDGLKAQQRDLANQTSMSRVSLTLMSPDDARESVDPQPSRTWWESFLEGLADLWAWLGVALLITSPLLLAGAIIWWVRRRRA
jgi:uncharacterized small protein (DUF1192 family)